MQTHNLIQGTDAWHQYRMAQFNASDAPAMMGLSPYKTRSELLHERHTGVAPEISAQTQRRFDDGHRFETLARPLAEEIVGEDLYPVVGSSGNLSASFDGLSMDEGTAFEHKSLNDDLRRIMQPGCTGADLPMHYQVQMEQQCMVSGAHQVLFMASKWDDDQLVEERHCWYAPNPVLELNIRSGWIQFQKDLDNYTPVEHVEAPRPAAMMQLPALAVLIRGEVVQSNLPAFRDAATKFIANIKTELETDEDFANAAATVQFFEKAEKDLELTKSAALGQTASIDELMKTIDFIQNELRTKRLALDKLVTSKKNSIKEGAIAKARAAYAAHVESLEAEIKPVRLALNPGPDFVAAAKNKRTLANLHDALDTELANAKIKLDAIAKTIRTNLAYYAEHAADHKFLFVDIGAIALKEYEDFTLLVRSRIEQYTQAENERVQAEDRATATAAAAISLASQPRQTDIAGLASSPAPVFGTVRSSPAAPPALRLGQIVERLGFVVTAEFLRTLGFDAAARDRAAVLYHERDFGQMCVALIAHITAVQRESA